MTLVLPRAIFERSSGAERSSKLASVARKILSAQIRCFANLRRDGKDGEAIKYFEQSAQLGYQAGFADLGFTYCLRDFPVRDAALSYAWLTVAIAREAKAPLRAYLESSRAKVVKALSESELAKAQSVAESLGQKFSSIPVWSDKQ